MSEIVAVVSAAPEIPAAALALIRAFEGCRLQAYRDAAGIWTIGYGHTGPAVKPGLTWTGEQCESALRLDALCAAASVHRLVAVALNDNQRAALISFVFNLGAGRLEGSLLRRRLNAGDYAGAVAQFARWTRAGGRVLPDLVRRREAERRLFLGLPEPAAGV